MNTDFKFTFWNMDSWLYSMDVYNGFVTERHQFEYLECYISMIKRDCMVNVTLDNGVIFIVPEITKSGNLEYMHFDIL